MEQLITEDTRKTIEWVEKVWKRYQYNKDGKEAIQEYINDGISMNGIDREDSQALGELIYDCFTSLKLTNHYQAPEINICNVDWAIVATKARTFINLDFPDMN